MADLLFPKAFREAQIENNTFPTVFITNSLNILLSSFNPSKLKKGDSHYHKHGTQYR